MSEVYLNFSGQAMAMSGAARAWLDTTGAGQTLTAGSVNTQMSDQYGGGTLVGGAGDDTFGIMDSGETISDAFTSGVNTVDAWASYALPLNVNNITLQKADLIATANSGSDLMIAAAAAETLIAGSGSDVMVDTGAGGDFLQFGANTGQDVIYGFQASGSTHDYVQLTSSNFTSFADIQSHLTQVGADTLLTLSPTQQILLRNTQVSSLTASDFALNINLNNATPTFDDEFNSLSLYNSSTGTGTWKTSFLSGSQTGANSWSSRTLAPNNEQEIYVDPNYAGNGTTALGLNPFSINNGVLTITASKTPTQDLAALNNYQYASGLLTTEKSFTQTYGYFEIRAELPAGQGVWPAFWMLPADGSWPPELDVMEQIGGSSVFETSHYPTASGGATATAFSTYVPGNTTGFHTYGVLWTPTTLSWYVDGVEVASAPTPADMNKPMYMLVNLAVGGNWPGSPPSNFTSAQMEVDYVRAYSLASLGLGGSSAPATPSNPTPPTSTAESYSAKAGAALTVTAAQGVLAGDADHNGLALMAALASNGGPSHGTLTLNADGSFTYTPFAGFAGTDSFTYIPSDSASTGSATTVTLNVAATAPTTAASTYAVKAGASLTETAAQGALAGDTDNNGLALTAALAVNGGPAHGSLTLNADGSFSYTPNTGYAGSDSFTYVASDSLSTSGPVTVTLNVAATAATTTAAAYGVKVGGSISETAAQGVLAGDVDHNGLTLTAALASNGGPQHGTLTLNADGSFNYTPNAGYGGSDSFTYIASDTLSSSAPTTVTLNVSAAAIVTHSAAYSVRENTTLSVSSNNVLSFDSDSNGLTLSAALAPNGGPAHGTLTLNADGTFTYTPNSGYYGTDSFSYVASDGVTTSAPVTVGLKVSAAPPQSHTDYYTLSAGPELNVAAASGVLANDTDPNGLTLSAALAANGGPAHGSVTLNADGSFSYTPDAGYVGADSFKYVASDSQASGSATTVNLTVSTSAPTGQAVTYTAPTGQAVTYTATAGSTLDVAAITGVLAKDTENNGLTLAAKLGQGPSHGVLTLDANGSFSYTPNSGFVGTDSFTYSPQDALATGAGTVVTIDVVAGSASSTSTQAAAAPLSSQASESRAAPSATASAVSAALATLGASDGHATAGPVSHDDAATPNYVSFIQLLGAHPELAWHIGHGMMP